MTKSQKIFGQMLDENADLFDKFESLSPKKNRDEFNRIGEQVMEVIKKYEGILCGKTESANLGQFSGGLAGKFWELVRLRFADIDEVGMLD